MSLFGGLFAAGGGATSSLFSNKSIFRRDTAADAQCALGSAEHLLGNEAAASLDEAARKARKRSAASQEVVEACQPAADGDQPAVLGKAVGHPKKKKKHKALPEETLQIAQAQDGKQEGLKEKKKKKKDQQQQEAAVDATKELGSSKGAQAPASSEGALPAKSKKSGRAKEAGGIAEQQDVPALHNVSLRQVHKQGVQPSATTSDGMEGDSGGDSSDGDAGIPGVSNAHAGSAPPVLRKRRRGHAASDDDSGASEDEDMRSRAQLAAAKKPQLTPEERATRDAVNAEKLERTIFVGNLPLATTPKQLKQLFTRLDLDVESVRLRSVPVDPEAKMPRRSAILTGKLRDTGAHSAGAANGYVVFVTSADVDKALEANMSEYNGHHIRVDRAAPPRHAADVGAASHGSGMPALFDVTRSIFVGNLNFLVKDEEVIAFFNDASRSPVLGGAVEAVRLVRDKKTNIGKGFGFVLFRTKMAARAALALDGQKLDKRPMRITRATQQAQARPPLASARPGQPGKPSGGPARPLSTASTIPASQWQGVRTKGKGAGVRGPKALHGDRASGPGAPVVPANRAHGDKRPSVAARKMQANTPPGQFAPPSAKRRSPPFRQLASVAGPRVKKPRWVPRTGGNDGA